MASEDSHQPSQGSSVGNAVLMLWFDSKQTKNETGLLFNIFATAAMRKTQLACEIAKLLVHEICYLLSLLSKPGAGKNESKGTMWLMPPSATTQSTFSSAAAKQAHECAHMLDHAFNKPLCSRT